MDPLILRSEFLDLEIKSAIIKIKLLEKEIESKRLLQQDLENEALLNEIKTRIASSANQGENRPVPTEVVALQTEDPKPSTSKEGK